jgi:hypothetical protein
VLSGQLAVLSTSPSPNQTNIAASLTQITVAFSQDVSAASLATATINGSNVTGLAYVQGDGTPDFTFNIEGQLQAGQNYTVTIPASAEASDSDGTNTLGTPYTFSFTTAANGGTGGTLQTNVVPALVQAGVGLSWPTVAQTNYTVQWTAALGSNTVWTTLSGPTTGDGTTNLLFQPFGTNSTEFFRIQQSP